MATAELLSSGSWSRKKAADVIRFCQAVEAEEERSRLNAGMKSPLVVRSLADTGL